MYFYIGLIFESLGKIKPLKDLSTSIITVLIKLAISSWTIYRVKHDFHWDIFSFLAWKLNTVVL